MDVLALGDYVLLKEEQPEWPEGKGEGLENEDVSKVSEEEHPEKFMKELTELFHKEFWPVAERLRPAGNVRVHRDFRKSPTEWKDSNEAADLRGAFELGK